MGCCIGTPPTGASTGGEGSGGTICRVTSGQRPDMFLCAADFQTAYTQRGGLPQARAGEQSTWCWESKPQPPLDLDSGTKVSPNPQAPPEPILAGPAPSSRAWLLPVSSFPPFPRAGAPDPHPGRLRPLHPGSASTPYLGVDIIEMAIGRHVRSYPNRAAALAGAPHNPSVTPALPPAFFFLILPGPW